MPIVGRISAWLAKRYAKPLLVKAAQRVAVALGFAAAADALVDVFTDDEPEPANAQVLDLTPYDAQMRALASTIGRGDEAAGRLSADEYRDQTDAELDALEDIDRRPVPPDQIIETRHVDVAEPTKE